MFREEGILIEFFYHVNPDIYQNLQQHKRELECNFLSCHSVLSLSCPGVLMSLVENGSRWPALLKFSKFSIFYTERERERIFRKRERMT